MIMVMVFGLSAAFAGTYVAFTSKEEFEEYYNSNHSEWDADQKAFFEETTADLSAKQKKRSTLILVCGDNDGVIKNHVIVYHNIYDSKAYGVIVFDDNFDIIIHRQIYVPKKQDPVMVGLSCIKEQVTHIVDIDNQTVIFESCDTAKE